MTTFHRALRRPLPARRPSLTVTTDWNGHPLAVTVGLYPDGSPGEVFCDTEHGGTLQASIADACVQISLGLQHGIAPADLAKSLGRVPAFVNGAEVDAPASPVGAIMAVVLDADKLAGMLE